MIDRNIAVSTVWASRGKVTRAEPVSALYEQGRMHHIGSFSQLGPNAWSTGLRGIARGPRVRIQLPLAESHVNFRIRIF
jgi:phage terminase large subunit-like protein